MPDRRINQGNLEETAEAKLASIEFREEDTPDDQKAALLALAGLINKKYGTTLDGTAKEPTAVQATSDAVINTSQEKLSPEAVAAILSTLEARFKANEKFHKGIGWNRVKASLEGNDQALRSIDEMEKAGHEPDVYFADKKGFEVGTCSTETPSSGRNCVFDEETAKLLRKSNPNAQFNGSAEAMAKTMGIDLMSPAFYRILQKLKDVDVMTWSWLKTDASTRALGLASYGARRGSVVHVSQSDADFHNGARAWRGSLRVNWVS